MASPAWPDAGYDPLLDALQQRYLSHVAAYNIPGLLTDPALGRRAVVSSFGTESVVLLHYVVQVLPAVSVLFIDTGKHFDATLRYRDLVVARLGLNLVAVRPDPRLLSTEDPAGALFERDPNMCCTVRKVFPLQDALVGFDCWISGRKRYQGRTRAAIPILERDGAKLKVNPLALWDREMIGIYMARHGLPPHPLEAAGYPSIGCAPCTRAVALGEDLRAGRWSGTPSKVECGIHLGPDGRFARRPGPPGK